MDVWNPSFIMYEFCDHINTLTSFWPSFINETWMLTVSSNLSGPGWGREWGAAPHLGRVLYDTRCGWARNTTPDWAPCNDYSSFDQTQQPAAPQRHVANSAPLPAIFGFGLIYSSRHWRPNKVKTPLGSSVCLLFFRIHCMWKRVQKKQLIRRHQQQLRHTKPSLCCQLPVHYNSHTAERRENFGVTLWI